MNLADTFYFVEEDDFDTQYFAQRQDGKYTISWEEDNITAFTDYDVEHVEDNIIKKVWIIVD